MVKQITCDGEVFNLIPVNPPELSVMSVGNNYLIRTVTMYAVGRYMGTVEGFAILDDASWVADTAKFSKCLSDGTFNEVEYAPAQRVRVNLGSTVDIWDWKHKLTWETK
jgi:hypothetical protein